MDSQNRNVSFGAANIGITNYAHLKQGTKYFKGYDSKLIINHIFQIWSARTECSWSHLRGSLQELNSIVLQHLKIRSNEALKLLKSPERSHYDGENCSLSEKKINHVIFDLLLPMASLETSLNDIGLTTKELRNMLSTHAWKFVEGRTPIVINFLSHLQKTVPHQGDDAYEEELFEECGDLECFEFPDPQNDFNFYSSLFLDTCIYFSFLGNDFNNLDKALRFIAKRLAQRSILLMSKHACFDTEDTMPIDENQFKHAVYFVQVALSLGFSWDDLVIMEETYLEVLHHLKKT